MAAASPDNARMKLPGSLPVASPDPARRGWFKLIAGGSAAAALGTVAWRGGPWRDAPASQADVERATLSRIVDRIVPRDESPGAVDLGIDAQLIAEMETSAETAMIYGRMLAAIDRGSREAHRAAFIDLDDMRRDAVLLSLSLSPVDAPGLRGWILLRQQTMALYYARPESWPALGLSGPPQPAGFVDYTEPPRSRT